MIVTCPSCSASYMVPSEAISGDGRHVKCKKCAHVWFQEGEKKVIDDLINRIQASDIDIDNIDFNEVSPKKKLDDKEKVSLFQRLRALLNKAFNLFHFSASRPDLLRQFSAFMVALALVSSVTFLLVSNRWAIVSYAPSLFSAYKAFGFPLYIYSNANPEDVLIIENATYSNSSDKKFIQGNLINLSSDFVRIPKLKLSYVDENNSVTHEEVKSLPYGVIKKEQSYKFQLELEESKLEKLKTIQLSFVD